MPQETLDLIAKPGWIIEIQHEVGFRDKFKLYVHDEQGNTLVRVCKLEDEQFNIIDLVN